MRVAQPWGEGPTSRESPYRDSCTFEALVRPQNPKNTKPEKSEVLAKQKKMPLTKVAISTDQCTARAESVQGVKKPL